MKPSIYVCHHKRSHIVQTEILKPIHVGKAMSRVDLGIAGDDSGDNISFKNASFCELTALYWVWKNDHTSTHIGLMHYRRFLDFNEAKKKPFDNHGEHAPGFFYNFNEYYGLDDQKIQAYTQKYDIILPKPFDTTSVRRSSVYELYAKSDHHFSKDLDALRRLIKLKTPDYAPYFESVLEGHIFHTTNIFVMRRDLFDSYCTWLFGVLFDLEKETDISHYTAQEARVFGYLSERMFDAWLYKTLSDQSAGIRFKELMPIMVHDTEPLGNLPKKTDKKTVSVAIATDLNFLDHAHALIISILEKFDFSKHALEIVLLDGGIGDLERNLLKQLFVQYPKAKFIPILMKHSFDYLHLRPPFTKETFYRLVLPSLLLDRDRVLYLDADIVVNTDIGELFDIDLEGAHLAAARDLINVAFQRKKVPSDIASGGLDADVYAEKILGLGDEAENYFQAGVLLLDLAAMRQENIGEKMIEELRTFKYWFLDQDVLNMHFKGKVLHLEQCWNVVYLDKDLISALDHEEIQSLSSAYENPKIVHYAGLAKPWRNELHPNSWLYWSFLRNSFKYEVRLKKYISGHDGFFSGQGADSGPSQIYLAARKVYRKMPRFLRMMIPERLTYALVRVLRS